MAGHEWDWFQREELIGQMSDIRVQNLQGRNWACTGHFRMFVGYLTHRQKVLRLYKRSLRHLESWICFRDAFRYEACLLRARFEEHKNEKDMVKATLLLKAGEEEFWRRQHPQPYIFPDSPGGTSYERYDCYKCGIPSHPKDGGIVVACQSFCMRYVACQTYAMVEALFLKEVPEWALEHWHPSEKAMYPDYFGKREAWKKLQEASWDKEVAQLQAETDAVGPKTEALPPARKAGELPPLWWDYVTRPRERPT